MKRRQTKPDIDASAKIQYYARLTPQEEGGFLVEFPDLPGCLTEGDSLEDALANAREALSGWLYVAVKEDDDIPAPTVYKSRRYHPVTPDLDVTIPLLILWTRKRKGLTQEQMAEALGVTQQAYRKLEIPGKSNPRLKTLARLFDALGLEVELREG
ncbi:MAG: type II toxin-antitoxin system HicB family antitoxin [Myxococcales bacterium]|nr:MAG: type II toxin-antitoxin system HicB family antitoxin [Myxococcales bacterium]